MCLIRQFDAAIVSVSYIAYMMRPKNWLGIDSNNYDENGRSNQWPMLHKDSLKLPFIRLQLEAAKFYALKQPKPIFQGSQFTKPAKRQWCPILDALVHCTTAVQYFVHHHGINALSAIFRGNPEVEKLKDPLFSHANTVFMSAGAAQRFRKGFFVLVPDVPDAATAAQKREWENSPKKGYKIRVLVRDESMYECIVALESDGYESIDLQDWKKSDQSKPTSKGKRFVDLDGQRVNFPTHLQPWEGFVFFHYLTSLLRTSWNYDWNWHCMRQKLRALGWQITRTSMPMRMLKPFIVLVGEEAGLQNMKAYQDYTVTGMDYTAILKAIDQIRLSNMEDDPQLDDRSYRSLSKIVSSAGLIDQDAAFLQERKERSRRLAVTGS